MDEQPSVSFEKNQREEEDEVFDEQEETILPTNVDQYEESDINLEDSTHHLPMNNQLDDIPRNVRSRKSSVRYEEQPSTEINHYVFPPKPSHQASMTPSVNSSTAPITPIEPPIRVEINEKTKPFIPIPQHASQRRSELTPSLLPPPPPPSSQPARLRRQPTEMYNRTPIKIAVSDKTTGRR